MAIKDIRVLDNFKNTIRMADTAAFCTAGVGALLLIAGGLHLLLGSFGPWAVRAIGVLGLISSGLAG
jgi:hypothetical protein